MESPNYKKARTLTSVNVRKEVVMIPLKYKYIACLYMLLIKLKLKKHKVAPATEFTIEGYIKDHPWIEKESILRNASVHKRGSVVNIPV